MMSIPTQGSGGSKVLEDCRDYLRTGRCKYGGSCKYNHPPNVQNGGGLKPIDPSEPLFPSRPNEPICQYFLKHGTCKFGQACKFDHPQQNAMHVVSVGGQVQLMNVQRNNVEPQMTTPMMFKPVSTDTNGMVLQFLPQRVDEPDCIYFLKNGRCKYGATCRYHHPVPQGSRRVVDSKPRRQPDPYNRNGQNVQYVAQMYPSYSMNQGGQRVASYDQNPVTFINVDGNNGPYQIVTGSDGVTSYCIPTGSVVVTEQNSSTSSIASSYEPSQDHLNEQWNRARHNGSGNSLNAVPVGDGRPQRVFLSHSVSEGNIIPRQARSTSYGSASEMNPTTSSLPRHVSAGQWNQRMQASQYISRQDPNTISPNTNHIQRRLVRRRDPREGHDEGFTMMTSALLNMLDTPDEAAGDNISDDEFRYQDDQGEVLDQVDYRHFEQMSLQDRYVPIDGSYQDKGSKYDDRKSFQNLSDSPSYLPIDKLSPSTGTNEESQTAETGQSWSPSWLGATEGPDDSAYAFSLMPPPASTSRDSDVGLYLP